MSLLSILKTGTQHFANLSYEHMAKTPAMMFLLTGAFGWILSSIAQVVGVATNKKLDPKEKKFLIPQEIADAIVNVGFFMLLTHNSSKVGGHFVKTGKIATKGLIELYKTKTFDGRIIEDCINKRGKAITKTLDIGESAKVDDELGKAYFPFADGVAFLSSVAGSILSCNIVTPIIRNKIASYIQKRTMEKNKTTLESVAPAVPLQHPLADSHRTLTPSANVYSSGSMKV